MTEEIAIVVEEQAPAATVEQAEVIATPEKKKVNLAIHMARQNTSYYTEPDLEFENINKKIVYALRSEGLFEIRKNSVGIFVIKRETFTNKLPGFPKEPTTEGFIMNYGKIPGELFQEIIAFFKDICDESKDEVYVQTFWDPQEQKYFNHVPKQTVSGASVRYDRDVDLEQRCVLVLETHSHNTMSAFFSGTDNADEKADRFFGVVGELNKPSPAMLFSFVCGGKRISIKTEDIFQFHSPSARDFSDWKKQVSRHISTPYVSIGPSTSYGSYGYYGNDFDELEEAGSERSVAGQVHRFGDGKSRYGQHRDLSGSWGTERGATTNSQREKEIKEEIQQAAEEAKREVDREMLLTAQVSREILDISRTSNNSNATVMERQSPELRPYFNSDLYKSKTKVEGFFQVFSETLTLFKFRGATMSTFEKEQAFARLMETMGDEDVISLCKVMIDFGNQEAMMNALGIDEIFETTEDTKEEQWDNTELQTKV